MTEEAKIKICNKILSIMETYHEQDKRGEIGSPGGLEHMGDVWRLFRQWESDLKA